MRAAVLCLLLFGFRSDPSPLAGIPAHGLTYANDDVEFEVPAAVSVAATQSNEEQAQVEISSVPSGAEIELDGKSVGTTPASIQVSPGEHVIAIKKQGYAVWEKKTKITSGKVQISASLEAEAQPDTAAPPAGAAAAQPSAAAKPGSEQSKGGAGQAAPASATPAVHLKPNPAAVARGKKAYGQDCAMCHGDSGDGKTELAADMKLALPDFRDPNALDKFSNDELFAAIMHGKGSMQAEEGRRSTAEVWDLVNYVLSLAKK